MPVAFDPQSPYLVAISKINSTNGNERMEDMWKATPPSAEQLGYHNTANAYADIESSHSTNEVASTQASPYAWNPPVRQPKVRNKFVCFLLYVMTFSFYQLVWLYLVHRELPRRDKDMTGNQVLMHLILFPVGAVLGLFALSVFIATMLEEATGFVSALVLIMVLGSILYYLVMSVVIYSQLTERINELAPRQYQRWDPPAVNRNYATTAILAYWIPYFGIFVSLLCWYMWWKAAQNTLNGIARGEDIEELTDVFA